MTTLAPMTLDTFSAASVAFLKAFFFTMQSWDAEELEGPVERLDSKVFAVHLSRPTGSKT